MVDRSAKAALGVEMTDSSDTEDWIVPLDYCKEAIRAYAGRMEPMPSVWAHQQHIDRVLAALENSERELEKLKASLLEPLGNCDGALALLVDFVTDPPAGLVGHDVQDPGCEYCQAVNVAKDVLERLEKSK